MSSEETRADGTARASGIQNDLRSSFADGVTIDELQRAAALGSLGRRGRVRSQEPAARNLQVRRWHAQDHGRTALEEITELLERTAVR